MLWEVINPEIWHICYSKSENKTKRHSKDCSTITELSTETVAEVEIVSLVEESLPQYRLKQDYLASFGGSDHQDWTIKTPVLSSSNTRLTPEQAEATLDYFVSCGDR